ncbi:hypothetical protein ABZU75_12095 [Streptosporangium sp. NPDC005286]
MNLALAAATVAGCRAGCRWSATGISHDWALGTGHRAADLLEVGLVRV